MKLLEYVVDYVDGQHAYTLLSTKDQPLEYKHFDEWKERTEKDIASLEKKLSEAPDEEKADLQTMLDEEKASYERYYDSMHYTISPSELKFYRETLLPYIYVATPSFLVSGEESATKEFTSLIKQYQDGKIDINRFIREADGKLMMMQSE